MSFDHDVSTLITKAENGEFVFSDYTIVNPPLSSIQIIIQPITSYSIKQENLTEDLNPALSVNI